MFISTISIDPFILKIEGRGALQFHMDKFSDKEIKQTTALLIQGLGNTGVTEKEYKIEAVL